MPIDFPSSPLTGQSYTYLSKQWTWNGTNWTIVNANIGSAGATGSLTGTQGGVCIGYGITNGNWFRMCGLGNGNLPIVSLGTGGTQYQPIWISSTTSFDLIAVYTGTVSSSGTMYLGIYNDHATSPGRPGTIALNAGAVGYTASNTVYSISINQTLQRGWYWLASYITGGSSTWRGFNATLENYWLPIMLGDPSNDNIVSGFFGGSTFSNNPDITLNNWTRNCIFLRS